MRVALIVVALFGGVMASPRSQSRIVGGTEAAIEQYPFMASMEYSQSGVSWWQSCGGTLLTSTTILSVAHCYMYDAPNQWRARLGTAGQSGGQLRPLSRFVIHPNYVDRTLDYDIAIIGLAVPATLSSTIGTARIPGSSYNLLDGTSVTAIGWGSLSTYGSPSEVLRHVDIDIINQELCHERYEHLKTLPGSTHFPLTVTDGMICAGILDEGGKSACYGDYGGPLVYNGDVVIGVMSWSRNCAEPLYPTVSTRVSYFSDWIIQNAS